MMMTSFGAFLFTAVVWMPNGAVEAPIARAEPTLAECQADALQFVIELETVNASNSPAMQMSYHVEPCKPVLNDSIREGA